MVGPRPARNADWSPGDRAFDAAGLAPDVEVVRAQPHPDALLPGYQRPAVGETIASLRAQPGEADAALQLAARAIAAARSAAVPALLKAARDLATAEAAAAR